MQNIIQSLSLKESKGRIKTRKILKISGKNIISLANNAIIHTNVQFFK